MPRKLRQFEIGTPYHVVNRGVDKRKIFLKNQDYHRFILALEFFNNEQTFDIWDLVIPKKKGDMQEIIERYRAKSRHRIVELMAFALMPNHYHLIVKEIKLGGISLFMKKLGGYSTYFNKQYDRGGALFQSRFKAVPIKTDAQLNNVFVYVHTNPIELVEPLWKQLKVENYTNALNWLESYRWSSYVDYTGGKNFPTITQRDFFTNFYGDNKQCRLAIDDWVRYKAENMQLGPEMIE